MEDVVSNRDGIRGGLARKKQFPVLFFIN